MTIKMLIIIATQYNFCIISRIKFLIKFLELLTQRINSTDVIYS